MCIRDSLPANPVDLEQREGRVHRYKGHAIRKNLASAYRGSAFADDVVDPWEALFAAGVNGRLPTDGDLVPFWVFAPPGGSKIERYVPALPMSREVEKLEQLKRSLAAYRLAFGQPRQEDLIKYLQALEGIDGIDLASLVLDLSPPHREYEPYEPPLPVPEAPRDPVVEEPSPRGRRAFLLRMFPLGEDRVPVALEGGFVMIGWGKVGPRVLDPSVTRRDYTDLIRATYRPDDQDRRRAGSAAGQLWRFVREMRPGDLVVATHWSRLHVARVDGPATFDPAPAAEHWAYQRRVKWLTGSDGVGRDTASEALRRRMYTQHTLVEMTDLLADAEALLD